MKNWMYLVTSCALLIACSHSSDSSTGSEIVASNSNPDAQGLTDLVGDAANADIQTAANLASGPITWGQGLGPISFVGGFVFPFAGQIWAPESASCVTVQDKSTAANRDIIYTFNCTNNPDHVITGTLEFKSSSLNSNQTSEVITNVTTSNSSGTKRVTNSDQTIQRNSDGSFSIAKTYDDTLVSTAVSLELKGTVAEGFTPDTAGSPLKGGAVTINNAATLIKNATTTNYTVVSTGLNRSSCGFDKGSIEIKNATDDIIVTYTGCGQVTITDNGKSVTPSEAYYGE